LLIEDSRLQPEVATIGDNCIDRYGPPISLSTVGGNALNVAVQLRRAGLHSAYFGAVGQDRDGQRTIEALVENQVDVGGLSVLAGITAFTELTSDASGDRIMGLEEFGVCRGYRPSDADFDRLTLMRHVHLGWLDDEGATKHRLVSLGISVSQDLAVNRGATDLDIAFASAGPSRAEADRLCDEALAQGARLVVVTMGALGSLASDGVNRAEMSAKPIAVLDTLGAGDTFIAGFLAARLAGFPVTACLAAGRDAAAETCTHFGGFPQQAEPFS
jgi:fructoselysine 6-kinase